VAALFYPESTGRTGTIENLRKLTLTMIGNLLILLAAAGTLALGALQLDSFRRPEPVRVRDDDEASPTDPDAEVP